MNNQRQTLTTSTTSTTTFRIPSSTTWTTRDRLWQHQQQHSEYHLQQNEQPVKDFDNINIINNNIQNAIYNNMNNQRQTLRTSTTSTTTFRIPPSTRWATRDRLWQHQQHQQQHSEYHLQQQQQPVKDFENINNTNNNIQNTIFKNMNNQR
jgi:hypothetical protein